MSVSNWKKVKTVKPSAVSDHLLECDCSIDFRNFGILAADASKFNILIKDSLLIRRDKTVLNKRIQSYLLKLCA